MRVAYLALLHAAIIAATSSPMLAFVSPSGRRVLLGLPPPSSYTRVVSRHQSRGGGGFGGGGSRRHGPPDPLLPREESPQQQQRLALLSHPIDREMRFTHSRRALLRRRVSIPKMKAKGVDTKYDSSTPAAADNAASPSASAASTPAANGAENLVGTRIRLRDTGRLGTVVGKKAGGWWIVELLESWGGGTGASGGSGRGVGGAAAAESTKAATEVTGGATRNANTVVVAAGGGPVSTRRVNMEPLGDAYASSSPEEGPSLAGATLPRPQAVARRRRSTAASTTSSSSRKGTKSTSQKKVHIEGSASTPTATAAAVRGAAGGEVSVVEASMKAQAVGREMPTTEEETVAIHAMSAEGLAHAEMTEWLVFSDLHVSPTSLGVSLEVSVGVPRQSRGNIRSCRPVCA